MRRLEWPTLALLALCYAGWAAGTWAHPVIGIPLAAVAVALFSSLQHEATHGHPTGIRWLDAALVFPALTLVVPFERFRDTHSFDKVQELVRDGGVMGRVIFIVTTI